MIALTLLSSIFVILQATASPAPSSQSIDILRRQTNPLGSLPGVPSQCESQCTNMESVLSQCGSTSSTNPLGCLCNTNTGQAYESCLGCAASLPGLSAQIQTQVNQALDSLNNVCQQNGTPFNPPLSINGATSNSGSTGGSTGSTGGTTGSTGGTTSNSGSTGGTTGSTGGTTGSGTTGGNVGGSTGNSGSSSPIGKLNAAVSISSSGLITASFASAAIVALSLF